MIALRIGYAYNWFDTGPALTAIGSTFSVGPAQLGLLVAMFLVGAGLLQVPAGFLALRFGARAVSVAGVALLAATAAASAVAPSFDALLLLRLGAGFGAALFFSPAIGLVASLYPAGRKGLPVGTFSSAFSAGAALGIVGSSFLVPMIGWRGSLLVGGALLGILALAALVAIPREAGRPAPRSTAPWSWPVALRFPGVWIIGFAFVGVEGAAFATGQFIVPFGETVRGWSILLAGVVGMMFVFPSTFGGPVGGSVAERYRNHRTQFVAATLVAAGVLALVPWAGLVTAVLIGIVFSFSYGFIYAVMYVLPHFWTKVPSDQIPLAIGLFNSIQLSGGAVVSFLFGWVVSVQSYGVAWEFLAVAMVVTLVVLVALPATGPGPGSGPPLAEDPSRNGALAPSRTAPVSDSPDSGDGAVDRGSARAGRGAG
ncbi:MAG: MFS transporter [Thermoplasmata archaeon]|nr:MFS transporter [Thermoplasmata archaeon]